MISVENIEVYGWGAAIRGMRNPMNSWSKSDSFMDDYEYFIGNDDLDLMKRLIRSGTEHRKFLRMVHVQMDVVGPLYWWKEYDTYKVGTAANSCSTMHKLMARPLTMDDFSTEHLGGTEFYMRQIISAVNGCIQTFQETGNKDAWYAAVQLLPSSYNQKRTVDLNYEVALTMIHQRTGHKLDEWNDFTDALKNLPYIEEFIQWS